MSEILGQYPAAWRRRWVVVFRPAEGNGSGTQSYLSKHRMSLSRSSEDLQKAILYQRETDAKNARRKFRTSNQWWVSDVQEVSVRFHPDAEPEILDEAPARRVEV